MPGGKKKGALGKELYNESHQRNTPLQHMFKTASKPDDVTVFLDEEPFISPVKSLYDLTTDEKSHTKAKDRACMIDTGKIQTFDITLSVHGHLEDDAYSLSPFLVKNIRRGNTIIEVKEEEGVPPKYYMGRKGLPKFFDMKVEYIDAETRYDTS